MLEIPIRRRDFFAIVDDCDAHLLSSSWYAIDTRKNRTAYVTRQIRKACGKFTTQLMHRVIMNAKPHEFVDHVDGDGLNNRRSNLRFVTKSENAQNRGKPRWRGGCTSKYKGVTFNKHAKKFYAYIDVNKKRKFLGYHATPELCAKAYNVAALKYHSCPQLNVIEP